MLLFGIVFFRMRPSHARNLSATSVEVGLPDAVKTTG